MAVTAAVVLTPSTVYTSPASPSATTVFTVTTSNAASRVRVATTFTNDSAGSVNVLGCILTVPVGAPFILGDYPVGFGQNVTVPGNGTLVMISHLVPLAPVTGPLSAVPVTFSIGTTAQLSDGQQVVATAATLSVNGSPALTQSDANANAS